MITVKIVTPAGEYKTVEDVYLINVDTTDGMRGILPRHMPIVLALEIGKLELVQENQRDLYSVNGGMLYFENDKATILTDAIEYSGDIDLERAKKEDLDELRARLALRKAINRIRVKEGSHS